MLHAFDRGAILGDESVCSDGGAEGRPGALHVDVVLDRGGDAEERGKVLLHVPLVLHGPVPLLRLPSLLVALSSSPKGVLEVVLSDDAGLPSEGGGSCSVDGDQLLGGDTTSVQFLHELREAHSGEEVDAGGSDFEVVDDLFEGRQELLELLIASCDGPLPNLFEIWAVPHLD